MGPAVPETGAGAAAVPETGGSQGAVPETGTSGTAARTAQPADSGTGLSVWLVPALLVIGAGVLVARAARRPAPATTPAAPAARPSPGRPQARKPARPSASRTPQRPKSTRRR